MYTMHKADKVILNSAPLEGPTVNTAAEGHNTGRESLVRQPTADAPQTFRVQQFCHAKLILSSVECQLQVLQWLRPVHLGGVVEYVGTVAVENGTECRTITPTGGEVGHVYLITADRIQQTQHTQCNLRSQEYSDT